MKKHKHNFKIVLKEMLANGEYKVTQACECSKEITYQSKTGDWIH